MKSLVKEWPPAANEVKKAHQDVEQQSRPDLPADRVCAVAKEIAQLQALLDLFEGQSGVIRLEDLVSGRQQQRFQEHSVQLWLSSLTSLS